MKRFFFPIALVCVAILVGLAAFPGHNASAAPSPHTDYYHRALTGKVLPDNGSTKVVVIPFRLNQNGALSLVSLQDVSLNGTCCATLAQNSTIVATVLLDRAVIATLTKSTTAGAAFPTSLNVTTTHSVRAGAHTLSIVYASSIDVSPVPTTGMIISYDGTVSMEVVAGAVSN